MAPINHYRNQLRRIVGDIWRDTSDQEPDAYHQAGHAVIALRESLQVVRVSLWGEHGASSWIDVTHPYLGQSRLKRSATARSDAKSVIRSLLAGPAAQLRHSFGSCYPHTPPGFDLADPDLLESEPVWRAIALAGKTSNDGPFLVRALWGQVTHMIQGNEVWQAIEAVAQALLLNGELTGWEVCDIANHALRPRKPL